MEKHDYKAIVLPHGIVRYCVHCHELMVLLRINGVWRKRWKRIW